MPKLTQEVQSSRKEHILNAALICFANNGYFQTSIDQIAQEAKLSKGSIYTYFDSKKSLYLELLQNMISDTGLLKSLSLKELDGSDSLKIAMQGMATFVTSEKYPAYTALILEAWTQSHFDKDIRQTISKNYTFLRELFKNAIKSGIDTGKFKNTDPDILASILIAIFDGLMVQAMLDHSAINWQESTTMIQETIRGGIENNLKEDEK